MGMAGAAKRGENARGGDGEFVRVGGWRTNENRRKRDSGADRLQRLFPYTCAPT